MCPTFAKRLTSMRKNKSLLAVAAVMTLMAGSAMAEPKATSAAPKGQVLEAPIPGVVTVSDYELNTFAFPGPIKRVYFPAQSPVLGTPIYLADNSQVMLQFAKGTDKPVQMVTELVDGQVVQLRVQPRAVPGVVHSVNGARAKARPAAAAASGALDAAAATAPRGEDIELLKQLVATQEAPQGFEPVALPGLTRFDKFSVVPLSSWSDGSKRVMVFSLVGVPGQASVVSPPQFYRPGITAVMVDGDVVDETNSPQLFVVEEMGDE